MSRLWKYINHLHVVRIVTILIRKLQPKQGNYWLGCCFLRTRSFCYAALQKRTNNSKILQTVKRCNCHHLLCSFLFLLGRKHHKACLVIPCVNPVSQFILCSGISYAKSSMICSQQKLLFVENLLEVVNCLCSLYREHPEPPGHPGTQLQKFPGVSRQPRNQAVSWKRPD